MEPEYIPAFCDYTGATWDPRRVVGKTVLFARNVHHDEALAGQLSAAAAKAGFTKYDFARTEDAFPHGFEYAELVHAPAFIVVPYTKSVMHFFELYRMNVPLFAPSVALLASWELERHVMAERVYWPGAEEALYGRDAGGARVQRPRWPPHPFEPNAMKDPVAVAYWLKFSDIYTFPHIMHFDSWEHLLQLLSSTDLAMVSARMAAENVRLLARLEAQWSRLLKRMFGAGGSSGNSRDGLDPGERQVPEDFDAAMRMAYGTAAIGAAYGMTAPLSAEEPSCERRAAPELANANLKYAYQWQPPLPYKLTTRSKKQWQ